MTIILQLIMILWWAGLFSPPVQKLQRLPLEKKKYELKSPSTWSKRFVRIDPQTGKEIYYDPKPRIELFDAKALKYYLKWVGYDGKEKTVVYQRRDCVDVMVIASANSSSSGTYYYEYEIKNLETSGDYLHGFMVQNFSSNVSPRVSVNIFAGQAKIAYEFFKEGNWLTFAAVEPHPKVQPGQVVKFALSSPSRPGLVSCTADGGSFVMKGVGEDLPPELEEALPRQEILPKGFTIGPVDKLGTLSLAEKAAYLLNVLPECQRQGWITTHTLGTYEQLLKQNNLQGIVTRIAHDLKTDSITTEVVALIDGIRNGSPSTKLIR